MYDAGVMYNHNAGPLARWLSPSVEDQPRTVPTSPEKREGSFPFYACLYLQVGALFGTVGGVPTVLTL